MSKYFSNKHSNAAKTNMIITAIKEHFRQVSRYIYMLDL